MDIELREWARKDAEELMRLVNNTDKKYLRVLGNGDYDIGAARTFIRQTKTSKGIFRAVVADGEIVGEISIKAGQDIMSIDGELGYYMDSHYEGRGIMTEAVALAVKEAWATLDIARISAYVCTKNEASMHVLEHNGFEREGTMRKAAIIDGEIVDVAIYAMVR